MLPSPRGEYESRLAQRRKSLASAELSHRRLSNFRLLAVLLTAAILWLALDRHLTLAWLILPAALFLTLVIIHSRVDQTRRKSQRAADFYTRALERLDGNWANAPDNGERFRDPTHPYADDLDLFGANSLFQLLNTARTSTGEATLASWLAAPATRNEVLSRQEAVDELRTRLDLREDLALLGQDFRAVGNPDALIKWAAAPPISFPRLMPAVAPVLASITLILVIAYLIQTVLGTPVDPRLRIALLVMAGIEGFLMYPLRERVARVTMTIEQPGKDLAILSLVLERLEAERFSSPKLAALRKQLDIQGVPASKRIASLERIIDLLDSRDHALMRVLGPLVLFTTQLAMAIERWRALSGPHVATWVAAAGEIEALSALASFAYEHPADPFPTIAEAGPIFEGTALGHPLIPESKVIRNNLSLSPSLGLIMISGSNMSGKSTFLRTVGINTVLALAGAPVRAESLTISPIRLGASIRINDSLQAGASRFYAEITRLRDVVAIAEDGPLLFLLDELLNGTNSHDRRIGAEGVVRGLVRRHAIGLVTTHDLALAAIADSLGPLAANKHFEDHLENGIMTFDYRMRPGVVEKSNALELMRAVGLDVAIT